MARRSQKEASTRQRAAPPAVRPGRDQFVRLTFVLGEGEKISSDDLAQRPRDDLFCSRHGQSPWITASGSSPDRRTFSVEACCDKLMDRAARALDEESRDPEAVKGLLDGIEEQLPRLSHELRPTILDDLGLGPALELLAEGVSARNGLSITLESMPGKRLPARIETVLYRIVQEALSNVSKHARASALTIGVRSEDDVITCAIRDDGVGFDVSGVVGRADAGGIGLIGIRERLARLGGMLEIHSAHCPRTAGWNAGRVSRRDHRVGEG